MKEFFIHLWTDESFFVRVVRVCVALSGHLMAQGVIPTGIPNGGTWLGPLLESIALFVPAGQMNAQGADQPKP